MKHLETHYHLRLYCCALLGLDLCQVSPFASLQTQIALHACDSLLLALTVPLLGMSMLLTVIPDERSEHTSRHRDWSGRALPMHLLETDSKSSAFSVTSSVESCINAEAGHPCKERRHFRFVQLMLCLQA